LLLLTVVGVIQGVGLLMILPFLNMVGVGGDKNQEATSAGNWLISAGEKIGISWNLETALTGFVIVVALTSLLKWWQAVHSSNLVRRVTERFQNDFYRHWLFQPWAKSNQHT